MQLIFQLDCCGWENPRKEFAATNEWIDDTCYQDAGQGNSGVLARFDDQSIPKKMKNVSNILQIIGNNYLLNTFTV